MGARRRSRPLAVEFANRHPKPATGLPTTETRRQPPQRPRPINASNINLAMKWVFPINHFVVEATPVVVDGVMFVTGPNQVFALDAQSGRTIWHYQRDRSKDVTGDPAKGTNRGVAVLGDRVFFQTDNAHMVALHRVTGALLWDAKMPEGPQNNNYGSTSAPLVVKDLVIGGVAGGDQGVRGFLAAYRVTTGERAWRFWTVPLPGEPKGMIISPSRIASIGFADMRGRRPGPTQAACIGSV